MTDAEKTEAPDHFWNPVDKAASSGTGSDSDRNERAKGRGRGAGKGGRAPKILGCRYINNREECPHGEQCHFKWAHRRPPMQDPVEFDRRPLHDRRTTTPGPSIVEDTSDYGTSGSAASSSGSKMFKGTRGVKPTFAE
jgi:hypothetical protein